MKTPVETPAGMPVELQVAEGVGAPLLSGAAAQAQLQTQLQQWLLIVAREVARVAAAAADNLDAAQLCVRVCDAEESRALNESYRGKAEPTNVLSFSAAVDVPGPRLLGDLAICWPVVQREAHEQGKELAHHFTHLYIHGVLHLLGFDHQEDEQAGTMEALEITILQELGIANPYLVSAT